MNDDSQDATATERSKEACPVCGQHRLALLQFPTVDVLPVRQLDEIYGFTDPAAASNTEPGIGCLNCGSEWPDLAAFRAAQRVSDSP